MKKHKVVLDTNVLVSALGWKGNTGKILDWIIEGKLVLVTSPSIIDEFKEVIFEQKFKFIPAQEKINFISLLTEISLIVESKNKLNLITDDPSDNKILEAAIAGNADFIISGDKHLIGLKKLSSIKILSPSSFLKTYNI